MEPQNSIDHNETPSKAPHTPFLYFSRLSVPHDIYTKGTAIIDCLKEENKNVLTLICGTDLAVQKIIASQIVLFPFRLMVFKSIAPLASSALTTSSAVSSFLWITGISTSPPTLPVLGAGLLHTNLPFSTPSSTLGAGNIDITITTDTFFN